MHYRSPYQRRKAKAIAITRKADAQMRFLGVVLAGLAGMGLVLLLRGWAM